MYHTEKILFFILSNLALASIICGRLKGMNKREKKVTQLVELIKSKRDIEEMINSLPKGYISVKKISGRTYYYRQWREGSQIKSQYVEEDFLNGVKAKIQLRKDNEALLRIIKHDLRNVQKNILKNNYLTIEQVMILKENVSKDALNKNERQEALENYLPEYVDTKLGKAYIEGISSYNQMLVDKWMK